MTRLIDADALKEDFRKVYKVNSNGVIGSVIDNAPTVDAVPVEWIRKYTEENRLYQSDDFDLYINEMISDWWAERKEE